eukprot:763360-Hanusia_phi.AAC.6
MGCAKAKCAQEREMMMILSDKMRYYDGFMMQDDACMRQHDGCSMETLLHVGCRFETNDSLFFDHLARCAHSFTLLRFFLYH